MDVKMKKKLTMGLATIMGPHKAADDRAMLNVASPPPSPYPGRRYLPSKTETDLRAACAAVLYNTKPSHHYVAPDPEASRAPKPQLDYTTIKRSASIGRTSRPSAVRSDSAETDDATKYAYRPDVALEHLFPPGDSTHEYVQSNFVKPREESLPVKASVPIGIVSPDPDTNELARPSQRSGSAETTGSTPYTDTTEYIWSTSTAPTSAGVTPARTSKRASSHFQAEPEQLPKADLAAVEWMRNELERRRKKFANPVTDQGRAPQPESRASSRARSIRNNIKEYIRPGSGNVSREPSRPASRTGSRAASTHNSVQASASELPHERSLRGWRNWTQRSRKSEKSTDVSRSNSVRGRSETRKESRKPSSSSKPEINLNRDLPPLPSLDHWKEAEMPPAPLRQHPVPHHRPTKSNHSLGSTSLTSKMSEKDEIIAMRLGSPVKPSPEVYQPTRSNKSSQGENNLVFHARTVDRLERTMTHEEPATVPSQVQHEPMPPRSKSSHPPHRKTKSTVRAIPNPQGESSSVSTPRVNYSRLRSPSDESTTDPEFLAASAGFSQHRNYDRKNIPPALASPTSNKSSKPSYEQRYRHVMDVLTHRDPPPVPPKDEKKSWWHLKSGSKKQQNWMDRLEKMHIKNGVLVNDDACGSPVIRY